MKEMNKVAELIEKHGECYECEDKIDSENIYVLNNYLHLDCECGAEVKICLGKCTL